MSTLARTPTQLGSTTGAAGGAQGSARGVGGPGSASPVGRERTSTDVTSPQSGALRSEARTHSASLRAVNARVTQAQASHPAVVQTVRTLQLLRDEALRVPAKDFSAHDRDRVTAQLRQLEGQARDILSTHYEALTGQPGARVSQVPHEERSAVAAAQLRAMAQVSRGDAAGPAKASTAPLDLDAATALAVSLADAIRTRPDAALGAQAANITPSTVDVK